MPKRPVAKCALCLKVAELCKSHILPDFMYKELFSDDGKMYLLDLKTLVNAQKKTGLFEYMLCEDCERRLQRYEDYVHNVLYAEKMPKGQEFDAENETNPFGVTMLRVEGVDYKKLKLFLLSILWRSSVAKNTFFRDVSLGKYQERLRSMLMSENPGKALDFPCVLMTYRPIEGDGLESTLVCEPIKIRDASGFKYAFLISGIVYMFFVSPATVQKGMQFAVAAVNEEGNLHVLHLNEEQAKLILQRYSAKQLGN